jgi:tetratricopeptide (TPR) repeat protein
MIRTLSFALFSLVFLFASASPIYSQKGERDFNRGIKLVGEEKYYKAGMKFIDAYGKGYHPAFETLAYAALAFNVEGNNDVAGKCFEMGETEALSFASEHKRRFENIAMEKDTILFHDREAMYTALYTIADTSVLWKDYELKDEIDLLIYAGASIYCDESVNDTAIFYASLGLKYNTDPDLFIIIGDCWLEEEQGDSAFAAFTNAHELAPEDVFALTGIGEAFEQKEMFEEAMDYYEMALELDPTNIWALFCKAHLSEQHYEYDVAQDLYSRIIELNPSYYIAYFNRAGVYFELGNYEAAIYDYQEYLEFVPGDEDAKHNIKAAEDNMWNGN